MGNRVFRYLKEFGIKVTITSILVHFFPYSKKQNWFRRMIFRIRKRTVLRFLRNSIDVDYLLSLINNTEDGDDIRSDVTWTCWWQGIEAAPEGIKNSISLMKRHSRGNVIVLTKENYDKYISLPKEIVDGFEDGRITITHLTDVIRFRLLYEYGGIWLDAAIFPYKDILEEYYTYDYYSKKEPPHNVANVSDSRWCAGLQAGKPKLNYFNFMSVFFEQYWKQHSFLIDYHLVDYATEIAYRNISSFKELVDRVKINNIYLYDLERKLNRPIDNETSDMLNDASQCFIRLNRNNMYLNTNKNEKTLYGVLCENKPSK